MSEYIDVNSANVHKWNHLGIHVDGKEDIERITSDLIKSLDEKQLKRAIFRARSRSLQAGRTLGARLAREEYTARASKIKNRFFSTIVRDGEEASLRFSGFPGMNMGEFLPRPKTDTAPKPKKGASVKIKRKGRRYVPGGRPDKAGQASKPFIAKIQRNSPDMGVFVRYGKAKKRHMLFGPSPIQALYSWERQDAIRGRIEDTFYTTLLHEIYARLEGIVK